MNARRWRDVIQFRVRLDEIAEHEPTLRSFEASLVFGRKRFHLVRGSGRF
jgi:hypothetical protein